MKTVKVSWSDFKWEQTSERKASRNLTVPTMAATMVLVVAPEYAHAAGWETAKDSILHILDYVCYGVIVFSGASWMFGHRNKALDLLLSCGIGTVIIRHADDIEKFFESI